MPKNQPRSDNIDFLGQKFSKRTCPKCRIKYECHAWDKAKNCPKCSNNVESEDNEDSI